MLSEIIPETYIKRGSFHAPSFNSFSLTILHQNNIELKPLLDNSYIVQFIFC